MEFNEKDHPRDKDGKFVKDAGSSSDRDPEEIAKEIFPHLTGEKKRVKIDLQFFTEEALQNQATASIKKGIRSKQSRIEEHKRKIANPAKYADDWNERNDFAKRGLVKFWEKEISGSLASIERAIEELKRRGEYDGE